MSISLSIGYYSANQLSHTGIAVYKRISPREKLYLVVFATFLI